MTPLWWTLVSLLLITSVFCKKSGPVIASCEPNVQNNMTNMTTMTPMFIVFGQPVCLYKYTQIQKKTVVFEKISQFSCSVLWFDECRSANNGTCDFWPVYTSEASPFVGIPFDSYCIQELEHQFMLFKRNSMMLFAGAFALIMYGHDKPLLLTLIQNPPPLPLPFHLQFGVGYRDFR